MNTLTDNFYLIALGGLVLSAAIYAAIDVLGRVYESDKRSAQAWTLAGSIVLASGLWSMHFLGILGMPVSFQLACDIPLAVAAWCSGFVAALNCYYICNRDYLAWRTLAAGAALTTVAIAGIFHLGIASLAIEPAPSYRWLPTTAAAMGVWIFAGFGMWTAYRLRLVEHLRGVTATAVISIVTGLGIAYCDRIALAVLTVPQGATSNGAVALNAFWLTPLIVTTTLFIMTLAVLAAVLDRRLDRQTASLLASLRRSNARLEYSSRHDTLTDLPNRATIYGHVEQICRRGRHGKRCALMYIDLDGFKLINDSLGHTVGDRLLQRASRAMLAALDSRHQLGRIGGDEFLLLHDGVEDEQALEDIATAIIRRLSTIHEQGATLSSSIGIAIYPDDADDVVSLVTAADMAMYSAKRAGKNRSQRYLDRMGSHQAEAFRIQDELRHGIQNNELVVYFQPKYRARDLTFAGAEALIRWQHPTRGLVLPGVFIEIAERSGLIRDLELCVIDLVCRQLRAWRDAGHAVPDISVNLSVARLLDEHLVDELSATLAHYDLAARHLVFEITETLAMQEFDIATRVLRQLHGLGVQIALDDFGTGYSSLSYLQKLPIQQLKIDRSFIASLNEPGSQYTEIVKLIINLAHVFDILVVAEGIENDDQLRYLQSIDCDELQGFLLDRPLPAAELEKRLVSHDRPAETRYFATP